MYNCKCCNRECYISECYYVIQRTSVVSNYIRWTSLNKEHNLQVAFYQLSFLLICSCLRLVCIKGTTLPYFIEFTSIHNKTATLSSKLNQLVPNETPSCIPEILALVPAWLYETLYNIVSPVWVERVRLHAQFFTEDVRCLLRVDFMLRS